MQGGEDIRARHEQNITRTHGREKVAGAWAPALAIEAEGGDAGAAPFTRARSALARKRPIAGGPTDGLWICARQRGHSNSAAVGISVGAVQLRERPRDALGGHETPRL